MKKVVLLFCFLASISISAQTFNFSIDHSTLIVNDLKKTGDFYATILRLKEIEHPTKDPGFRWFSIQGNTQLHLIYKDSVVMKKNKSSHICLSTQKLDDFIKHLNKHQIPFEDWPGVKNSITLRADGVRQIYLTDPEGYWIEINDAKHD